MIYTDMNMMKVKHKSVTLGHCANNESGDKISHLRNLNKHGRTFDAPLDLSIHRVRKHIFKHNIEAQDVKNGKS